MKSLLDLEDYAKSNNLFEVHDFLRMARRAASGSLKDVTWLVATEYREFEEHWFEIILDQLTRHAHELEISKVEELLLAAREAWDKELQRRQTYDDSAKRRKPI